MDVYHAQSDVNCTQKEPTDTTGIRRTQTSPPCSSTPFTYFSLSCLLFPIYPLTFHASGNYYRTIYGIARPFRAELSTHDLKPKYDREVDLNDMHDRVASCCRKLRMSSLSALIVDTAAFQLVSASQVGAQLCLLAVALHIIQGLYLSYAVGSFAESVTLHLGQSLIEHWTSSQRRVASTLMAIPEAFILGYHMLAVFAVLYYFKNPLAVSWPDFVVNIGSGLREELGQKQPTLQPGSIVQSLGYVTILSLFGAAIIQLATVQYVLNDLLKTHADGRQPAEFAELPSPAPGAHHLSPDVKQQPTIGA